MGRGDSGARVHLGLGRGHMGAQSSRQESHGNKESQSKGTIISNITEGGGSDQQELKCSNADTADLRRRGTQYSLLCGEQGLQRRGTASYTEG